MNVDDLRTLPAEGYEDAVARVAEDAYARGVAEVAYGTVPSPIGTMLAVVSHTGLLTLAFDSQDQDDVLDTIARKVTPSIVDLPSAIGPVRQQLDGYFGARLRAFDLPLDRSLLTPFQRGVLAATERIPLGEVRTYGEMAAAAGRPKGAQAAGQALGANPIPIVIPCHRVVAANGNLTGYAGGLERKRFLLDLEQGAVGLF